MDALTPDSGDPPPHGASPHDRPPPDRPPHPSASRDPLSPEDDGDAALEAALADPAFDDLPAGQDPGRPEDPFHEPGAPHLALDDGQGEGSAGSQGARGSGAGA